MHQSGVVPHLLRLIGKKLGVFYVQSLLVSNLFLLDFLNKYFALVSIKYFSSKKSKKEKKNILESRITILSISKGPKTKRCKKLRQIVYKIFENWP